MTNEQSLQLDIESRNRIVSETNRNFFVEAGAGSGKTTMLVNRMVAMVEQGKDIRKICAITFTKAAAGEFYERFQKKLAERSKEETVDNGERTAGQLPPSTDLTRKRCEEALQNIDLCFMGTIDSFCNMILSEHPSEAKIPSDASIMSDEAAKAIYKQEFIKICKGEYGNELSELAKSFREINRNPEDAFVKGIQFFMNNRNVHINYEQQTLPNVDVYFADAKAKIVSVLKVLYEHFDELDIVLVKDRNEATDDTDAKEVVFRDYITLRGKWQNRIPQVIYALKSISKLKIYKKDVLAQYGINGNEYFRKGFLDSSFTVADKEQIWEQLKNIQYQVSMTFLAACVPVIEKNMREKGCMTYFDYLYYLRNMVREDAAAEGKLISYIYDRHSYFLIDEFQDTNPMQAEVFFYLTAIRPVERWEECIPQPGALFIVGDPKQSIYRFRSADVASYLNVKKLFLNPLCGDVLYLSRNFRSRKILCELFNKVFSNSLIASANQSAFTNIPIVEDRWEEFEGFFRYKSMSANACKESPYFKDEYQIGRIIQILVDNPKYQIRGDDGKLRRLKNKDIMIITPNKTNLPLIMSHLKSLGIDLYVEGKVLFEENEALQEVYKIYSALVNAGDSFALYGALTGKVIGLSEQEIINYVDKNGQLSVEKASECADENAVVLELNKIKELQSKVPQMSPAALFVKIMDDYKIYNQVEADNLEVLYYALELLRSAEKEGMFPTHKDAANYILKLLDGKSEEERCLSLTSEKDCVHIANLHKVKGLEAPVVILAYAWPLNNPPTVRVEYKQSGPEGYLFKLDSNERYKNGFGIKDYFSTQMYRKQSEEEINALECEHKRLVYVAATRAKNVLIVSDSETATGRQQSRWAELLQIERKDFFENCSRDENDANETSSDIGEMLPADENAGMDEDNKTAIEVKMKLAQELYFKAQKESALEDKTAEQKTYRIEIPSHLSAVANVTEEEQENMTETIVMETFGDKTEKDAIVLSAVHQHPTLLGIMVHRLMEIMVTTRNKMDVTKMTQEIVKEYLPQALIQEKDIFEQTLINVAEKMQTDGYEQVNSAPRNVLSVLLAADEVYTEVPFCYKDTDGDQTVIWHGVMDVIYSENGKWHILDYKTNADGSDLDETYKAQMQAYMKAFKVITGQDADAKTYHIAI